LSLVPAESRIPEIDLQGKTVAVTGAAGFIGSALSRALTAEGASVIGVEVSPALADRVRESGAEPRVADVADRASTTKALEGSDLVVHTAAHVREWGSMEEFIDVNVRGTANVLDAAESAGAERVVHLSSVVVYGYADETEQGEEAHRRSVGIPYIDTKSASDRIAIRRGAVVVRPGDVYGPGSVPWTVRPSGLLASGQMAVPGKGDGTMLPVYIDDLVASIVLALRRGAPGHSYTVWDGEPVSFHDYFTRLAEATGGKPPRKLPKPLLAAIAGTGEAVARLRGRPPAFGRHGITLVDRRGTASNARARDELGWEPEVGLEEGLRRSAEWLRSTPTPAG
jgi:nucleoside-diphosphate-sugar epimerase